MNVDPKHVAENLARQLRYAALGRERAEAAIGRAESVQSLDDAQDRIKETMAYAEAIGILQATMDLLFEDCERTIQALNNYDLKGQIQAIKELEMAFAKDD